MLPTLPGVAWKILQSFQEDAFFLGLLHDIGILALTQCIPDQYALIIRETEAGHCARHQAETKILGFDHAMFGRHLLETWGIPRTFSTPIRYHHAPEELEGGNQETLITTRILHLSSLFVEVLFGPRKNVQLGILESRAQAYGFADNLDIGEMAGSVQEQAEEVLPLFEINTLEEVNDLQMIEEARTELISLSSHFLSDLLTQKRRIEELNQQVTVDSMTGLKNYRFFMEVLEKEINRSLRYTFPLSLVFADIDHFKKVNDTYGHLAGDRVLRAVAACIQAGLRDSDTAARYGGEAFAVVLPETDSRGARSVAERLRAGVETLRTEFEGQSIPVTMSFGTACFSFEEDATKSGFIQRADDALLQAKQTGRNRCCSHERRSKGFPVGKAGPMR